MIIADLEGRRRHASDEYAEWHEGTKANASTRPLSGSMTPAVSLQKFADPQQATWEAGAVLIQQGQFP
jgi:hypothetical protein